MVQFGLTLFWQPCLFVDDANHEIQRKVQNRSDVLITTEASGPSFRIDLRLKLILKVFFEAALGASSILKSSLFRRKDEGSGRPPKEAPSRHDAAVRHMFPALR
ncbi:hypothetical protein J6590_056266 [Homalodisca vitripennis]|nr:hypothetical protein J6590_056266 [Homalodisca vitripennis]